MELLLTGSIGIRGEKTLICGEPGLWGSAARGISTCGVSPQSKPLAVCFSYGVGENREDSFGFHQSPAQCY